MILALRYVSYSTVTICWCLFHFLHALYERITSRSRLVPLCEALLSNASLLLWTSRLLALYCSLGLFPVQAPLLFRLIKCPPCSD